MGANLPTCAFSAMRAVFSDERFAKLDASEPLVLCPNKPLSKSLDKQLSRRNQHTCISVTNVGSCLPLRSVRVVLTTAGTDRQNGTICFASSLEIRTQKNQFVIFATPQRKKRHAKAQTRCAKLARRNHSNVYCSGDDTQRRSHLSQTASQQTPNPA